MLAQDNKADQSNFGGTLSTTLTQTQISQSKSEAQDELKSTLTRVSRTNLNLRERILLVMRNLVLVLRKWQYRVNSLSWQPSTLYFVPTLLMYWGFAPLTSHSSQTPLFSRATSLDWSHLPLNTSTNREKRCTMGKMKILNSRRPKHLVSYLWL